MPFGTDQLSNPTPAHINRMMRVISVTSGVLLTATQSAQFIPSEVQNYITWFLGLVIAVGNAIAPFFGVEVTSVSVPTDQVKSMETEKK